MRVGGLVGEPQKLHSFMKFHVLISDLSNKASLDYY